MWRLAVRQLKRCSLQKRALGKRNKLLSQETGLWTNNNRFKSSVASATAQFTDVSNANLLGAEAKWELRSGQAPRFDIASSELPYPVPNPLKESVTALDAALHTAVHLPWLASHTWLTQLLSDPRSDGIEQYNTLRSNAQAALRTMSATESSALELVPEEEVPVEEDRAGMEQKERQRVQNKLYARQRTIETMAWQRAVADYKVMLLEMCKKNLAPNLPFVQSLILGWFEPLKKAIEAEQKICNDARRLSNVPGHLPYIVRLPADILAVITMHKIMATLMADSRGCVKVVTAAMQIGDAVEAEVGIHKLLQKKRKRTRKKADMHTDDQGSSTAKLDSGVSDDRGALQERVEALLKNHKRTVATRLVQLANSNEPWTEDTKVKVGCCLIHKLIDTALLHAPANQDGEDQGDMRPAFKHSLESFTGTRKGHKFGVIRCDPLMVQHLDKSARHMVMPYMPMLVKPRRWKQFNRGGHLVLRSNVMRVHGAHQQRAAIETTSFQNIKHVFQALDTLGEIRWRINRRVLAVIEKLWSDGGGKAQLVDVDDVPLPKKPSTDDGAAIREWKRQKSKAKQTNRERHALRCDTELKLNVARKLQDEEAFYFPHNLDFRGRAYPLHPHLNHLGSDMCRGTLEFAEGRPLGVDGFRWLKIHLANVFANGVDKMSFDGRVRFVDGSLDEVFDSAERPLEGRQWWLGAEDPFQCLASCMNIRDAILSGNVENFVSHLPVHQDGSCNGLQHYAALGRDKAGAESVNLIAGEKPADVYTGIALRVRAVMEKEAASNGTRSNSENAKLLINEIDRKLVKQTVMTSVYGVTFIGARNQITNRLKERGFADDSAMFRASTYAAKVTVDALGEMFKEARCIMGWLGACAKIIASQGEPVRWTTPLGLPVVQPYRRPGQHLVKTSLQSLSLTTVKNRPVSISRQRSAFAPNFVHSLDGTHMMMTALSCRQSDIYFAGVHDSFWTHAGSVQQMNHLLRKAFVDLYSEPILENLLKSFKEQFPNVDFPPLPQRGTLELSEVMVAPYFFN